jgi:hypothetical protein
MGVCNGLATQPVKKTELLHTCVKRICQIGATGIHVALKKDSDFRYIEHSEINKKNMKFLRSWIEVI